MAVSAPRRETGEAIISHKTIFNEAVGAAPPVATHGGDGKGGSALIVRAILARRESNFSEYSSLLRT